MKHGSLALSACGELGASVLLVVPRRSTPGRALALKRGARLEHSEHTLRLRERPSAQLRTVGLSVREASAADAKAVSRLIACGFGRPPQAAWEVLADARSVTLVAELDARVLGTIRLTREGQESRLSGFVIDAAQRGRGIGRELLSRVCARCFDDGATSVGLEVALGNERALRLYTGLGFTRLATDDYYELTL